MRIEEYYFTKNGIKIPYDIFLLELRRMYRTELAYNKEKERLLHIMNFGVESWNLVSKVHLRIIRKRNTKNLKGGCNNGRKRNFERYKEKRTIYK